MLVRGKIGDHSPGSTYERKNRVSTMPLTEESTLAVVDVFIPEVVNENNILFANGNEIEIGDDCCEMVPKPVTFHCCAITPMVTPRAPRNIDLSLTGSAI